MNKSFLASSAVIVAAAALGYWMVAEPDAGAGRRLRSNAPAANQAGAAPNEEPATVRGRDPDEFINLTTVYEGGAGEAVDFQKLLESVATEYLPPPRVVKQDWDWLLEAGEEQSSPPDRLTLLLRHVYRLAALKCVELVAKIEPLIGAEQFWSKMNEDGDAPVDDLEAAPN
jgi:hypothetical protein